MPDLEASLAAILQTSLDAVIVIDAGGFVRGWNHHADRVFGWPEDEAMGRRIEQLVIPGVHHQAFRFRFERLAEGVDGSLIGRRFELHCQTRTGAPVPIELGMMRTDWADETLFVCFARDLTDQKRTRDQIEARTAELIRTREQLAAREELYRQVLDLSRLLPWTCDAEGRILAVGDRWIEWTGARKHEAFGLKWTRFMHPDDQPEVLADWAQALRHGHWYEGDWRVRMQDGGYRWVRARASKCGDPPPGRPVWYGTLEDVHEQRLAAGAFQQAQAELAHVSRLSAMGAMASAIAHDLNQPLTAVANYVRGCRRLLGPLQGPGKDDVINALDDADANAVRAGDIVRRVREFVTRGHVEVMAESLTDLVEEACRFALVDAPARGIRYRLDLQANCPVLADRVQIQQVLVNLMRNAVNALEGQPRRELTITTQSGPEGFCQVSICDSGKGIPPEAAERIFDPFYTTRTDGMGIGLSISRMLVEAHGGAIWNDTRPGGGTMIAFTLPIAPTPAASG
jgi:two-component system sensor kinase FixL